MLNKNVLSLKLISLMKMMTFITFSLTARSQTNVPPPLKVVNKVSEYNEQATKDSTMKMIELKSVIPGIVYDLRYATRNNFMKRRMYPSGTKRTFLRAPAVLALAAVQKELNQRGLGLKIYDAYRPYSVTVKFWELVGDERYVANPSKGSGHNRGIAVDLTIIKLDDKSELDMGTGFDNFTDTAHHEFMDLPKQVLENRRLLLSIMEKNGFRKYDTEWWHYFLPEGNKYEVLDLSFRELRR
jgi:D-alanyl-D-alanine dipeptidase